MGEVTDEMSCFDLPKGLFNTYVVRKSGEFLFLDTTQN